MARKVAHARCQYSGSFKLQINQRSAILIRKSQHMRCTKQQMDLSLSVCSMALDYHC